jgi:hypothetical protein
VEGLEGGGFFGLGGHGGSGVLHGQNNAEPRIWLVSCGWLRLRIPTLRQ